VGRWSGASRDRERALDALRAIALVRVVLWHTYGNAAITYVIAAVPTMFFVTGSLFAKSAERRPVAEVVRNRVRRIFVPLWAFSAVCLLAMSIAHRVDGTVATDVPWRGMWLWFIPLADPNGSPWEGGHLSAPLWFVRAMLWVLLAAPLLLTAARRSPALLLAGCATAILALDLVGRHPSWRIAALPDLVWQSGDVALYAMFFTLGVLHRWGTFRHLRSPHLGGIALASAVLGAAWITTQPVPKHVVNNSHPAHLFVGLAWLAVALAALPSLERAAAMRPFEGAISLLSQRSFTIYLWHPAGIVISFVAIGRVDRLPFGYWSTALLLGTLAVTSLLVIIFGSIEDVASRKAIRWWPAPMHTRRYGWVPALAGLALMVVAFTSISVKSDNAGEIFAARQLTVPSQAPPKPKFDDPTVRVEGAVSPTKRTDFAPSRVASTNAALAPAASSAMSTQLGEMYDAWIDQWGITGAEVGVTRPNEFLWQRASGVDVAGVAATLDTTFDIGSITKTFTTAILMQLVQEGVISLDEPLPTLRDVPAFPYTGQITVRDLLFHRSGLVNYRDTAEFIRNPLAVKTPAQAVMVSAREPLRFAPGSDVAYTSTNFLLLGMLIEQRTGRSFDDNLRDRLLTPLGLEDLVHLPSSPGAPNQATAGLLTSTEDLLRWGSALYRDGRVVDAQSLTTMTTIDPVTGLGGGTFGYCPCTMTPDEQPVFTYVGHSGGTTILRYAASEDLVISINLSVSVWTPEMVQATADFFEMVRAIVRSHDAAAHPAPSAPADPTAPSDAPSTEPAAPADTAVEPTLAEPSDGA
jgi:CubicO group peptidase (beta-lactamase class C family)/peptidoglycan/LPS O-acetylase OafA/YrhL